MSSWLVIVISIFVFSLMIWALIITCPSQTNLSAKEQHNIESWVNYQELPYRNIQSGAGGTDRPLVFYNYPIYRRPYNWPVCNLVDYPIPHCRSNSF